MNEAHIRRVIFGVSVASVVGVFIIVIAFIAWRSGFILTRPAHLLFLASTLLIAASVLFVAATIPYIPKVTPMLVTGAVLTLLAMVLEVLDDYAITAHLPFLGREGFGYMTHFDDALFYTGLGVTLCSAYLAILDAALGRIRLMGESEEKTLAIQEAQRYAQALARSERVAREQLAEIQNLYNSAPAGLCFVDSKLRCHRVNQFFARLNGVTVRAHLGQPLTLAVPVVGKQLTAWCEEALRSGIARNNEEITFSMVKGQPSAGNSKRHTWLVSLFPMHASSASRGVQLVVQDITALRKAEEMRRQLTLQVQQAQKTRSLGALAAGVAHDFNNLLTGILGNTSLLLREENLDARARRLLEAIVRSAERSAELTYQMLAYSGHGAMEARPVAIDVLVREAIPVLEEALAGRGELAVETDAESCTVLGDGAQLRQALVNLVTNAAESLAEEGGVVTVRTGRRVCGPEDLAGKPGYDSPVSGEYAFIEVSDTGSGMDDATVTTVFDPFYSTKFAGRGLGLAVVLGVARHHKGVIELVSAVGAGSRFQLLMPVLGLRTPEISPPPKAVNTSDTMVLIIDDEEAVRTVAEETVIDMGYACVSAPDGQQGVQRFLEFQSRIKLVLLDLSMPGMDGPATFQALRAEGCMAPIVVVSGYAEDQITSEGLKDFDYFCFVQKPFTYEGLCHVIRGAIESKG